MSPTTRFEIPAHLMVKVIDGQCLVLDVSKGTYYGLDAIGLRVWQLIGESQAFGEICDCLLSEFDVSAAVLERDIEELVLDLEKNQLITQLPLNNK